MQSKMVFKICERISYFLHSMLRDLMTLFMKKYFPCTTLLNFWPFCTPNHKLNWWLKWELGIVTRSYWRWLKKMVWERLSQLRMYVHFPLIQANVSVVIMLISPTHFIKRVAVTIQIIGQRYSCNPIPGHSVVANATQANVSITPLTKGLCGLWFQSLKSSPSTLVIVTLSHHVKYRVIIKRAIARFHWTSISKIYS